MIAIVIPATRNDRLVAYDAHAYYQAAALQDPYRATIQGGFEPSAGCTSSSTRRRSPRPSPRSGLGDLAPVPRDLERAALAVFVVMGGRWALPLLVFPPLLGELWLGNINLWIGRGLARVPLAGGVGVHHPDEDHARDRAPLVRRPA